MSARATSRTDRAVSGALVSFLQYGVQILLQVGLVPFVLRIAGQEVLGAYALLMQVIGYLTMLDLGFSASLNRYLAQASGYDDGGKRFDDVLTTARTFMLGSNVVFAFAVLLLSTKVGVLFSLTSQAATQARCGLYMLAVWGVLRTPWVIFNSCLSATQHLAIAGFIGMISNVSRLLLSLVSVFCGMGLVGLLLANVLAEALSTGLSALRFRHLYPDRRLAWGIPDWGVLREMFAFGLYAMLINIGWRLVYYTDNIVVGYLYNAAAVSIYYTTQMPTTIGFNIVNRISDNASPAINELYARRDEPALRRAFLRLHRYNMLLALPLAGGILLLNDRMIGLWVGSGQYAGQAMTMALAAFTVLITSGHVSSTFVMASGQIGTFSRIVLFEGVTNLGLSIWLGHAVGLPGVMIATVMANIPTTVYVLLFSMRNLGVGVMEYLRTCVLPLLFPSVIACAFCHLSSRFLVQEGWISFIIEETILIVVYCSIAYTVTLSRTEREWFRIRLLRLVNKAA